MMRSSDAFLCQEMILCGITATPPHREITKTAIGAENSVSWRYQDHTIDAVKDLKSPIWRWPLFLGMKLMESTQKLYRFAMG